MLTTQSREAAVNELADEGKLPVLLEPGNPFALRPKALIPFTLDDELVTMERRQAETLDTEASDQLGDLQERRVRSAMESLSRHPKAPEVLNNAGLALLNAGRIEEAETYFSRALDQAPTLLQARANLAKANLLSGRPRRALEIYQEIVAEEPGNTTALMNIAQIQAMQGEFAKAEGTLTGVIRLDSELVAAWTNRGLARLAQRQLDEAISDLRRATRIAVRDSSAHNGLGVAYALKGSSRKAERAFKTALAIDQLNGDATKNLARLYLEIGNEEAAFELLDSYLAHLDQDIAARNLIGKACFLLERFELGIRHLKKALQIAEFQKADDQVVMLYNNLGVLQKARGNLFEAREFFEKGIGKSPGGLLLRQNLVDLLLDQGQLQLAQLQLEECFRIRPDDSQNFSLRGALATRREDYAESLNWFYEAIAIDPKNVRPYGGLTVVLGDVFGRYHEVIANLEKVLRYHPKDRMMLNNLAYAYLMADEPQKARSILDRVDPKRDSLYLMATRGLLFIKEGNLNEGRRWYNLAAARAKTRELRNLVEQKKNLELARHFLRHGEEDQARRYLQIGGALRTRDPRFRRTIKSLLNEIGFGSSS